MKNVFIVPLVVAIVSLCGPIEICEAGSTLKTPVTIAPSGAITTPTPKFKWTHVNASSYVLLVKSATGTRVVNVTKSSASVNPAGASKCSLLCPKSLPNGRYSWQVRGKDANGSGPWSTPMYFKVSLPIPATPTLLAPSGFVVTTKPTYQWKSVANAAKYKLLVTQSGKTLVSKTFTADQVGLSDKCSATPDVALPNGVYSWRVKAMNSSGSSPWSASGNFDVIVGWDNVSIPGNDDGIELVTPKVAETIDLRNGKSYEFAWTTHGLFRETPWSLYLVGHPADPSTGANVVHWNFSVNNSTITSYGGIVNINAVDIANTGVTTDNGFYEWVVVGWYGGHPASRTFRILK